MNRFLPSWETVRGLTSQNLLWKLPGAVGGARFTGGGRHEMSQVWVRGSRLGTCFHGYPFRAIGASWCQGENSEHPGFMRAFREPQEALGVSLVPGFGVPGIQCSL